jgi:hypothetical protein
VLARPRRGVLQRRGDILSGLLRGRHQHDQLVQFASDARALLCVRCTRSCLSEQRCDSGTLAACHSFHAQVMAKETKSAQPRVGCIVNQ